MSLPSPNFKTLIFYGYNVFLLFVSVIVIWTFIYEIVEANHYINLFYINTYNRTLYCFLSAGLLLLISGILGLIGGTKKYAYLLFIYVMFLLIVIIIQMLVANVSYLFKTNADLIVKHNVRTSFQYHYENDSAKTVSIDFIHQAEKCCSQLDWATNLWLLDGQKDFLKVVPDSCCKTPKYNCGKRIHPSNIFYKGCLDVVTDKILYYLRFLFIVSFSTLFVPIFGVALGTKIFIDYRCFNRRNEEDEQSLTCTNNVNL